MNRLAAILPVTQVLVNVDATSKKRAFEQAGLLFENEHGVARGANGTLVDLRPLMAATNSAPANAAAATGDDGNARLLPCHVSRRAGKAASGCPI